MTRDRLPNQVVDQLLAADRDADSIVDTLIAQTVGSLIVVRGAVGDDLRGRLHGTTTDGAGCPHTGDEIFNSPRPIMYLPGQSIGSCIECLAAMLHGFSSEREGCDLCSAQTVNATLIVKDRNAVWLAEICDDCATAIQDGTVALSRRGALRSEAESEIGDSLRPR
jgi:hypothetical protein